jgi:hypothetical protein
MRRMSYSLFFALGRFSSFLFLALIIMGGAYSHQAPWTILAISILFAFFGIPSFMYSLNEMEKIKGVFDFEPTEFWGRVSNGGVTRGVLMSTNALGLWSMLAGAVLFVIPKFV